MTRTDTLLLDRISKTIQPLRDELAEELRILPPDSPEVELIEELHRALFDFSIFLLDGDPVVMDPYTFSSSEEGGELLSVVRHFTARITIDRIQISHSRAHTFISEVHGLLSMIYSYFETVSE